MSNISVSFTATELEILCSLASDQLFRREFIDPYFPGYKGNASDIGIGKKLVERLRSRTDRASGVRPVQRTAAAV
jgi:hypothetical protein